VGFASARQLQQHVKTYLRLSPTQLRKVSTDGCSEKSNDQSSQLSADVNILLAYRPPYNWEQVRDFFARREIKGNEYVTDKSVRKILNIEYEKMEGNVFSVPIFVEVNMRHEPSENGFYVSFNAAYSKHTLAIIATVRRMLDLDACPALIEQALGCAGLAPKQIVSGLRIPGVASEFEAGCRAILGQQVSVTAAVNKVNQLHEYFAQLRNTGNVETGFPSPNEIANSDLLFLKMPAARRQTLIALAKFYVDAKNDVKEGGTDADVSGKSTNTLINIKGIGPWTVNYIDLRAKGNTDIWLDTDLVIKQQVAKLATNNQPLNNELAAPWRSYLTLNLWSLA
jgi:AraC family transcriptional regulator of adaptative response / DNA-3-methyladenine glycosylase II